MASGKHILKKNLGTALAGLIALACILFWVPERLHRTLSVVCFSICAMGFLAAACVYFFTPKFLPYHQKATGKTWEELTPQYQNLVLAGMRIAAGGFFCASVSTFILLGIPFRQGLAWAGPAIFVIYNFMAVPVFYGTCMVALNTTSNPPLTPVIIAIILSFFGMILSL